MFRLRNKKNSFLLHTFNLRPEIGEFNLNLIFTFLALVKAGQVIGLL